MRVRVVTIFPELFAPFLATSLVGRAIDKGLLDVTVHDLRDYTLDRHRSVDGHADVLDGPRYEAAPGVDRSSTRCGKT